MGNRPKWRLPLGNFKGRSAFPANFKPSRLSDMSDKRQCKAMARGTGKQCRNAAMRGASCCRNHGGHAQAYRAELARHPNAIIKGKPDSAARKALAALGASEPLPQGAPHDASIIARGMAIEAVRNN
jgi:hypothetical protein